MPHTWSYQDLWKVVTKGPFVLRLTGAELLWLRFRTDPEVVRTVLPRPLRVPDDPLVTAFVARYPETNFGPSYREATVALDATYHGELGSYAIAMPVTDDMAMAGGREGSGYPKKMAEIELLSRGSHVHGRVARHGTEILRLEGEHKVRNPYGLVRKTLFRSDWPALMDFEAMPSHTFRERRRLGRKLSKY